MFPSHVNWLVAMWLLVYFIVHTDVLRCNSMVRNTRTDFRRNEFVIAFAWAYGWVSFNENVSKHLLS